MPPIPTMVLEFWRKPARQKWLWGGLGAFVLYTVTGFLIAPALLKWQLVKQLPALTHRQAAVRQVRCNPFALSLTVRGLELAEADRQPFVGFEEFYANFQLSSLFRWAWTFDTICLKEPRANLVLGPDGRFNFANLLESTNPPAPPKPEAQQGVPGILIFSLIVTNGQVAFADLTRKTPFRTTYAPINVKLERFTTQRDGESPYAFEASSDGGRSVAWAGKVVAQPPSSSGMLRIHGFQFPKHAPYLEEHTRAELTDGTLDVAAGYRVALDRGLDLVVSNVSVTVSNLVLKDPDTSEAVITVPSYELDGGFLDWRSREVRIGSIVLDEPKVFVQRRPDGTINLPALVLRQAAPTRPETNAASGASWTFTLDDYRIQKATVDFEDATVAGPFRTRLDPFNLQLEHFTTRTNADASLTANLATEAGESLKLTAEYAVSPAHGRGTLALAGIDLKKYQPYLEPFFRGQIAGGKVALSLEAAHAQGDSGPDASVSNLVVQLEGLVINGPDPAEPLISLPRFSVDNASASLSAKTVEIGAIESSGATIRARRETNGTINLLGMLTSDSGATTTQAPAATGPGAASAWRATLGAFTLKDYALRFEDRQTGPAAVLDLDQLALSIRGAAFPSNAPVQIDSSVRLNGTGRVAARGSILPFSPAVDLEISVTNLLLPAFQPWLDPHVRIGLTNGSLSTLGRFRLAPPEGAGPRLHFAGGVSLADLATTDAAAHEELVGWHKLDIRGLDVGLEPVRIEVDEVRLDGLRVNAVLGSDKNVNLLSVVPPAAAAPAPETTAPAAPAPGGSPEIPVRLGALELERASLHFEDRSIQPPCAFDLRRIDGTVKGLTSETNAEAVVDLTGRIDDASPFGLRGTVSPLGRDLALNLAFTNANLQLTSFSTYLEKYAGHSLNRGRLSLDLAYTLRQQQLEASNVVRIDQLMLGPRNESPDATKLPVKLAVALLKDRNGRIDLNLPVAGRLDDPEFSVFPIILKVVANTIVKAAASPFKLLGALVGGGEELSFVEFAPGAAGMREGETNKLDQLVKALEDRPALNLEIAGSIDPVVDRDAIARSLVQQQVKGRRVGELEAIGQAPADPDSFQPDAADQERLLRAMVAETFGTNLTAAVQNLAQRAATNTAVATEPASRKILRFFAPVTSWFKPRAERAALKQARRQAKADTALIKQNPELAALTLADLETLLAVQTPVPPDRLRQLMEVRTLVVQDYLLATGKITAERLFRVPPKTPDAAYQGQAKANLSLN